MRMTHLRRMPSSAPLRSASQDRTSLLALEFIGLPVIQREMQHVELGVPVDLKLDKSIRQRSEISGHGGKPPDRHELGRKDIAAPWFEFQFGARRLELHYQSVPFRGYRCRPDARMG